MSALDTLADKAQAASARLADQGGLKSKLADELAEDAVFLRKLKPSLIKQRAKGEARQAPTGPQLEPRTERKARRATGGGMSPFLVVGVALLGGIALAKWIDWRGHAHPRW
jgi:hypothetical protein